MAKWRNLNAYLENFLWWKFPNLRYLQTVHNDNPTVSHDKIEHHPCAACSDSPHDDESSDLLVLHVLLHEQSTNHIALKNSRDVMQSHPLCRMHFSQYQASSAALGWLGDRDYCLVHRMRSGGWPYSKGQQKLLHLFEQLSFAQLLFAHAHTCKCLCINMWWLQLLMLIYKGQLDKETLWIRPAT